MLICRTA